MPTVIIGAGIVGLHVAQALCEKGHEVFVLDQDPTLAEQTSGRNSGVIHSGIFYQPGSLKERTCLEGNRLTYEWLERLKVPHRRSGKWIVPEEGQGPEIEPFFEKVRALPIPGPELVAREELSRREPALRPSLGVFIPSTGIVDAGAYVKALALTLEERGASVVLNCRVTGVSDDRVETTRGEIPFDLCINSAGLEADRIAAMAGLTGYEVRPCRGDYYVLNRHPVSRPVYHLPYRGAPGLGVHLTPTLDDQTLIGPNAFFIDKKSDYAHHSPPGAFEKAVRYYLPGFGPFHLTEGWSGNRPKLFRNGQPAEDFVIERKGRWVHLLGIESPGLTAAPALAREVVQGIEKS